MNWTSDYKEQAMVKRKKEAKEASWARKTSRHPCLKNLRANQTLGLPDATRKPSEKEEKVG